jgi:hypothetical protein
VDGLVANSEPMTEILLKGLLASGFGTLLPAVHPPTRAKFRAAAQRLVTRPTAA